MHLLELNLVLLVLQTGGTRNHLELLNLRKRNLLRAELYSVSSTRKFMPKLTVRGLLKNIKKTFSKPSVMAASQNLLTNPTFIWGSDHGWQPLCCSMSISDNPPQCGGPPSGHPFYCVAHSRTQTWQGIAQDITHWLKVCVKVISSFIIIIWSVLFNTFSKGAFAILRPFGFNVRKPCLEFH